jgi:hypothetical protein
MWIGAARMTDCADRGRKRSCWRWDEPRPGSHAPTCPPPPCGEGLGVGATNAVILLCFRCSRSWRVSHHPFPCSFTPPPTPPHQGEASRARGPALDPSPKRSAVSVMSVFEDLRCLLGNGFAVGPDALDLHLLASRGLSPARSASRLPAASGLGASLKAAPCGTSARIRLGRRPLVHERSHVRWGGEIAARRSRTNPVLT